MSGPQRLGKQLGTIAGKALGKQGMAFGALLTDWAGIVGPHLADRATPVKLAFPRGRRDEAILHLAVTGPTALLLQHEEPQILERINAFFGWRAVARLKMVQAQPASRARISRPAIRLSPDVEKAIVDGAATVTDPALRDALERFGRAMTAR